MSLESKLFIVSDHPPTLTQFKETSIRLWWEELKSFRLRSPDSLIEARTLMSASLQTSIKQIVLARKRLESRSLEINDDILRDEEDFEVDLEALSLNAVKEADSTKSAMKKKVSVSPRD